LGNDNVACQQRAESRIDLKGTVRETGIARAKDQVWTRLDVELLRERLLHVDLLCDQQNVAGTFAQWG
jgi:hypothetical protein